MQPDIAPINKREATGLKSGDKARAGNASQALEDKLLEDALADGRRQDPGRVCHAASRHALRDETFPSGIMKPSALLGAARSGAGG